MLDSPRSRPNKTFSRSDIDNERSGHDERRKFSIETSSSATRRASVRDEIPAIEAAST